MKLFLTFTLLAAAAVGAGAQTINVSSLPIAPATCPTAPCANVTWSDSGAAAVVATGTSGQTAGPEIGVVGYCIGSLAGCGTPANPGANGWTYEQTPAETTVSQAALIPGLAYGQLVQIAVAEEWTAGGGLSAFTAPFSLTIGAAPVTTAPVPTSLSATQQQ
jgi:hypothetical protein